MGWVGLLEERVYWSKREIAKLQHMEKSGDICWVNSTKWEKSQYSRECEETCVKIQFISGQWIGWSCMCQIPRKIL